MQNEIKKIPDTYFYFYAFVVLLAINTILYWGFQGNYFFSDDFEWLSRSISMNHSFTEILSVKGRDFNPVFLFLLFILLKLFGMTPEAFRITSLLVFTFMGWMFFYILTRYFNANRFAALAAAILFNINVGISEIVLNLSALVYSMSLTFLLAALKFFLDKKKNLFFLFFLLAVLSKEIAILGIIPFLFFEKDTKNRVYLLGISGGIILLRGILQWGGSGSYTNFFSIDKPVMKFYFVILRSLNVSPYSIHIVAGASLIVAMILTAFYLTKKDRGFIFFALFLLVYALFFAFIPKLSSRYYLFPAMGAWGILALLFNFFKEKKIVIYAVCAFICSSLVVDFTLIKKEVGDYKTLGDFSRQFLEEASAPVKRQVENHNTSPISIEKGTYQKLAAVYQEVEDRGNLPKLFPFRENSIGGVIQPRDFIPVILYPGKQVRIKEIKETDMYFIVELDY